MGKSENYCFTWNNYNDASIALLDSLECVYIVYGKEVGESDTPHLQGFVKFANERHENAVRKLFIAQGLNANGKTNCANIEKAINVDRAIDYCMKGEQSKKEWEEHNIDGENYGNGADVYERGKRPVGRGKRTDLDKVREVLKSGGKMRDVVQVTTSYQSVRMAEVILKYHEVGRDWKPKVMWFWGATGTGKTKKAAEILGADYYTCLSTGKWFEGYDAHENVLIDDMRKDFMKFHELLRLLDRYPMRVECKGGSRQFLAKQIIITSCFHPREMFDTREDINQLLRRIDEIEMFEDMSLKDEHLNEQGF